MGNYITDGSGEVRNITKDIFVNIQNNNPSEVEAIFRKSAKEWEKWRTIIDRDLK